MTKSLITICVDNDLMDIVKELQSRRQFSRFIQDSLRSQRHIIESESLENERDEIAQKIKELQDQTKIIDSKLEEVKKNEDIEFHTNDLVDQYHAIVNDLGQYKYLEGIPVSKWPKPIRDIHYSKLSTINALKEIGFDLSKLKRDNSIN